MVASALLLVVEHRRGEESSRKGNTEHCILWKAASNRFAQARQDGNWRAAYISVALVAVLVRIEKMWMRGLSSRLLHPSGCMGDLSANVHTYMPRARKNVATEYMKHT